MSEVVKRPVFNTEMKQDMINITVTASIPLKQFVKSLDEKSLNKIIDAALEEQENRIKDGAKKWISQGY